MGAVASLAQPTLPVEPGGEAAVDLTVRNTGAVVDQFTIEVLGDGGAWATPDPPTLSLFPGAEGAARITFRPPRAPSTTAGRVRFGVMVRSREDPEGSVVEEGTLDVAPFLAPSAELIPRTSHGGRGGRHDLAIDNRGNTRLEAALDGIDPDRQVRFDFEPPNLAVEPGVAGFARVLVKPVRTFWRGPAKSRPFQLAVQPDAPSAEPVLLDGTFLQESILPWWFVRALLLAAALLIAAILLWVFVLQPQIKSTAAETLIEFGFSPKPTAPDGGPGPDGSPTPIPSGAVIVSPAPDVGRLSVDGRLDATNNQVSPPEGSLFITDLVFSNPTGASGDLVLQRVTPDAITQLLVLRLENFRDLDMHFVTPITINQGHSLVLVPSCTAPVPPATEACAPAVFFSGYVENR
jgi:hypothetical protein